MSSGSSKSDGRINKPAKSDEEIRQQMRDELSNHFADINKQIDDFMNDKSQTSFETEDGYNRIEKYTLKDFKDYYIDRYNNKLKEYGDGYKFWDDDDVLRIKYNNGSMITIGKSVGDLDGTQKIKKTGINSIILSSGWGQAYYGKDIEIYNQRETTEYGRYGYKDFQQRYYDSDDIRVDFKK